MAKNTMSFTTKNILIFALFIVLSVIVYFLWNVVAPFLISLVIAYILNPVVGAVEDIKYLKWLSLFLEKFGLKSEKISKHAEGKISRPFAVIAVFLVCVLVFVIVVVPVVFSVGSDVSDLIARIKNTEIKQLMSIKSRKNETLSAELNESTMLLATDTVLVASESERIWIFDIERVMNEYPQVASYVAAIDGVIPKEEIITHLTSAMGYIKDGAVNFFSSLIGFFVSAISGMANMFLVPILVFYILIDIETIFASLKSLIPPEYRKRTFAILDEIDLRLGKMLRGMIVSNSLFAALMVVGLGLCGLRFWFSIGLLSGILNFVPYLGGLFTLVISILVAIAQCGFTLKLVYMLISLAIAIGIVQFIDNWWSQPYIIGGGAGLSPLAIMLALAISGAVAGATGMILAVPLAVIFKIVGKEVYHELYDRT